MLAVPAVLALAVQSVQAAVPAADLYEPCKQAVHSLAGAVMVPVKPASHRQSEIAPDAVPAVSELSGQSMQSPVPVPGL